MNATEELSEDLKNNQYYVELLDELIEEKDMELKNRLQKGDGYTQFIQEQSKVLMNNTMDLVRDREVSFIEASSIAIEDWKERTFL
tara:strand:- start:448 stop:705 length:258 start_codon:yes stop_codon:yes gene_type:complete